MKEVKALSTKEINKMSFKKLHNHFHEFVDFSNWYSHKIAISIKQKETKGKQI